MMRNLIKSSFWSHKNKLIQNFPSYEHTFAGSPSLQMFWGRISRQAGQMIPIRKNKQKVSGNGVVWYWYDLYVYEKFSFASETIFHQILRWLCLFVLHTYFIIISLVLKAKIVCEGWSGWWELEVFFSKTLSFARLRMEFELTEERWCSFRDDSLLDEFKFRINGYFDSHALPHNPS